MKKIIICALLVLNFIGCTSKVDVAELISKRNHYQTELDLIRAEQEYRQYKACGYVDEYYHMYVKDYDEFIRIKTCEDSIELLNIEIKRYENGK